MEDNLPLHLRPLADYEPPPSLLPNELDPREAQNPQDDAFEDTMDSIAYKTYLSIQQNTEKELINTLGMAELDEFTYCDAPDGQRGGCFELPVVMFSNYAHSLFAFPTTRSQSKRIGEDKDQSRCQNGSEAPGELYPTSGTDNVGDTPPQKSSENPGTSTPDSPTTTNEPILTPDGVDLSSNANPEGHAAPAAPSARPPGRPTE